VYDRIDDGQPAVIEEVCSMFSRLVRLPLKRQALGVAAALAVLGGLALGAAHTPAASAQGYYYYPSTVTYAYPSSYYYPEFSYYPAYYPTYSYPWYYSYPSYYFLPYATSTSFYNWPFNSYYTYPLFPISSGCSAYWGYYC
jgi:hypothetical protein